MATAKCEAFEEVEVSSSKIPSETCTAFQNWRSQLPFRGISERDGENTPPFIADTIFSPGI